MPQDTNGQDLNNGGHEPYVRQADLDKLEMKYDNQQREINNIKLEQGVQKNKIDALEKTLDRISANTSRTFWTVVTGVIMLVINYFFNPPTPKPEPGNSEGSEQAVDTILSVIHLIM